MQRRYDYECQKCKTVFELIHDMENVRKTAKCPKCKKRVKVVKLIGLSTFKIGWDTNY